jgi:thiol-disulfide isomerase/thioredoxin
MPLTARSFTLVVALLAAAILLAAGMVGAAPRSPQQQGPPNAEVIAEFTTLMNQYQSVMPPSPLSLRDAKIRAATAERAKPVVRDLVAFLDRHAATQPGLVGNRPEFVFFGVVLGEESIIAAVKDLAAKGDETAAIQLAFAEIVVAPDPTARAAAVDAAVKTVEGKAELAAKSRTTISAAMRTCGFSMEELTRFHGVAKASRNRSLEEAFDRAMRDPKLRRSALEGKPLTLRGRLVDGTEFSTETWKGKVILVDFWATWCGPCIRSLPKVVEIRKKYREQGLEVIGVSCDKSIEPLKAFLAQRPELDWPNFFDPRNPGWHVLAEAAGVKAIPAMFLIDKNGVVRSTDAADRLDELIPRLLAE